LVVNPPGLNIILDSRIANYQNTLFYISFTKLMNDILCYAVKLVKAMLNVLINEAFCKFSEVIISAWNPMSAPTSVADNDIAHQQLLEVVANYPHFERAGVGDDGFWPPERSLLILGIDFDKAVELGRRFRQQAVVCGVISKEARLVVLEYI
jgi:hypothetical protein